MAEEGKPTVIHTVTLWQWVVAVLLGLNTALLVWCGVQLWLMNKFMIVYAIGTSRMEAFASPPSISSADQDLTRGIDPSLKSKVRSSPPAVQKAVAK